MNKTIVVLIVAVLVVAILYLSGYLGGKPIASVVHDQVVTAE
jgi:hypothetical protein